MTVRELSELKWLTKEIEQIRQELAELESTAWQPAAPHTSAPVRASRRDRMADYAAGTERIRGILTERSLAAQAERERLEAYISAVPDSLTRQIMVYHFVRGYSWGRTARAIGGGNSANGVRQRVYRAVKGTPGGGIKTRPEKKDRPPCRHVAK